MGPERRSRADQGQPGANPPGEEPRERSGPEVKSFEIDKRLIMQAWEKVRADNGAPGVDAIGIGLFQEQLRDNLFKLRGQDELGELFPGTGAGRGDTERSGGRRAVARRADGGGIVPRRPVTLRVS